MPTTIHVNVPSKKLQLNALKSNSAHLSNTGGGKLFHKSLKNFSSVTFVKELQSETGQLLKVPLK